MIETKLFRKINLNEHKTQRKLLRFVASLFDPLDFLAPLSIRLRKVLQIAWNHGPKWDKPLLVQNFPNFVSLRDEIPKIKDLEIPRNYFLDKPIWSVQLHTFTDASEFALLAVCYIRVEYSDQSIAVRFVIGKARVAPLKKMIIPNLELQAAVYGAQLAQFVKEEPDIDFAKSIFWSDSTTVLYWLLTPEMRQRIFIANRLAEILDVSSAFDWRYIPSAANPADDGTRGYIVYQMTSKSRWISGPSFLSKYRLAWPKKEVLQPQYEKIVSFPSSVPITETVFDFNRFSNRNKLIRVIAFCFFFADKCKKRSKVIQTYHSNNLATIFQGRILCFEER